MKYNAPFNSTDPTAAFVDGNPSAGIQGSIPPAAAIEFPQREIVAVIAAAGITPSNNDLTQLLEAILALGASPATLMHYGVDSGAANAMLIPACSPPMTAYGAGEVLVTIPAADNTGATTVNASNLGLAGVVRAGGAPLQPRDVRGGNLTFMVNDGTNFRLAFQFPAATSIIYEGTDTSGSPNALAVGAVVPALTSLTANENFLIMKGGAPNSAPATLNLLGTNAPVEWADGSALAPGDWPANTPALLNFGIDGLFRILSVMGPSVWARNVVAAATGVSLQIFNSSGTYTPTAGRKFGLFIIVGGGGSAGCSGSTNNAMGGSSGGLALALVSLVGLAAQTVTIGAGGPAQGTPTANGFPGGASSIGSIVAASGGAGGWGPAGGSPGGPGFGTIGQLLVTGNPGQIPTGGNQGGLGGASPMFGGAGQPGSNIPTSPTAGTNGGGGGAPFAGSTPGMPGGHGLALVLEW